MYKLKAATAIAALFTTILGSTPASAALPATRAGALDPTFGATGVALFNPSPWYDVLGHGSLQPDGRFVVAGTTQQNEYSSAAAVARLRENGTLDPSFAGAGLAAIQPDADVSAESTITGPDGSVYMIGMGQRAEWYECLVMRLSPGGVVDKTFGNNGTAHFRILGTENNWCTQGALLPDGKLVVAGYTDDGYAMVYRIQSNGALDTTFGVNGGHTLLSSQKIIGQSLTVAPDGRIALIGPGQTGGQTGAVVMLRANGTFDPAFNGNGIYSNSMVFGQQIYAGRFLADGKLMVAGRAPSGKPALWKFAANGTLDTNYGAGGVAAHLPAGMSEAWGRSLAMQGDGKALVALRATVGGKRRFAVMRVTAEGNLDTSFGNAGVAIVETGNTVGDYVQDVQVGPDGKIWLTGTGNPPGKPLDDAFMVVRLLGAETTTPVVEFYNSTLDHYFITADPNEAGAIDSGAAGPGWGRTGQTFKSGGPNRVCRFYGSPETNPSTGQRRGPNSHFYTIGFEECAAVKTDAGWKFESYDFNGWPAIENGSVCPQGTQPVKRVYNKRWLQNDSNHRYITTDTLYQQMLAQGWSGEGTVFCAAA